MTQDSPPVPRRQHFFLKLIAAEKVAKGILLLAVGVGLLFLDLRESWFQAAIFWVNDELMLPHGNVILFVLEKAEEFLLGTRLRALGALALVYAAVLLIEGVGVWFEKRWAEWLMVIATGSLIPLELYHLIHRPSLVKLAALTINVAIVIYLIRVLRRKHAARQAA